MSLKKFAEEVLIAHNDYRARHQVPPLEPCNELSAHAQIWADHLAEQGTLEHSQCKVGNQKVGENIAMKWSQGGPGRMGYTGKEATDNWYSEINKYEFGKEPKAVSAGHFTQVVWKDSKKIGVGKASNEKGMVFVVVNYSPPGNYSGEFAANVFPPLGSQSSVASGSNQVETCEEKTENLKDFANDALVAHNDKRAKHHAPPLKLAEDLTEHAQRWAYYLAKTDRFEHSDTVIGGEKVGENISMKWSCKPFKYTGSDVTEQWYSEVKDYVFFKEPEDLKSGHFTQVVWRSSRQMGIGKASTSTGKTIVVAVYRPAGNFGGRFRENVLSEDSNSAEVLEQLAGRNTIINEGSDTKSSREEFCAPAYPASLPKSVPCSLATFRAECLSAHNDRRKRHNVKPLKMADDLSEFAQNWAETLAKDGNKLRHSECTLNGTRLGENIGYRWTSAKADFSGYQACEHWYNEVTRHDFEKNVENIQSGHFSQIVWKGTTELGVGKARNPNGSIFVVGSYRPAGNISGQYRQNVFPPRKKQI